MKPFITFAAILALAAAKPQFSAIKSIGSAIAGAATSNCESYKLKPGVCAVLFEEGGCKNEKGIFGVGGSKPFEIREGSFILPSGNRDEAESVLVAPGASFRGYSKNPNNLLNKLKPGNVLSSNRNVALIQRLGDVTVLSSFDNKIAYNDFDELDDSEESDEQVDEDIDAVSCTFGSQKKCPAVPAHACALVYDEEDCDRGDWNAAYEIPVTGGEFELPGEVNGGIESLSIRKGCTLTVIDDDRVNFSAVFTGSKNRRMELTATGGKDRHITLEDEKDVKHFHNDIGKVICSCPGETAPVFTKLE